MIELNGMAHIVLNVNRWAENKRFYSALMPFLGMKQVFSGEEYIYFVGSRTAVGVRNCEKENANRRFDQNLLGLHHFCLRARKQEDIDDIYEYLASMKATVIRGPTAGEWAPGYYYVVFEDYSGTRIEVNYVPGHGVLAENVEFNPGEHYR